MAIISPATDYAASLVQENMNRPADQQLHRLQIMEAVWEKFPDYTEDAFRMMLYNRRLSVPRSPRRKGPRPLPPGKQRPKPVQVSGSVNSYHGRSRLLPGYYEL